MNTRRILMAISIGLLCCFQVGASCESDGGGGYDGGGGGYGGGGYPAYPEYDRPNRIPRWSDLVREGQGKLKWTADLDGDIYVYDIEKDFIPYTGPVRRGQEIVVQPDDDHIFVNGKLVYQDNLRRDGHYQIYFARTREDNRPPRPPSGGDVLPRGSTRLTRGNDYIEVVSTPRNGTLYLYDELDNAILYNVKLRGGGSMQVFRGDGYVSVNGKRTQNIRFGRGHTLSIYFKAD